MTLADALELRGALPDEYQRRSRRAMAAHVRAMLAFQRAGAVVFDYGNNLRAQAQEAGRRRRVRLPGLRAGLHPAAVLRGPRPVPLGRAVRRPGRHRADRPRRPRALPRRRRPPPLDRDGPGARPVPGPAGPDLLARLRRAGEGRSGLQRAGPDRRGQRARSSSGATTSTRARSPRPTARPRRCATARTRSPTGRSSTPWSTPRPARRGSRSTTAAASGSATRSTPGWSSSPTGRRSPPQKLERVLTTDPAMGVLRHVDAGYERAIEVARERGIRVPMLPEALTRDLPHDAPLAPGHLVQVRLCSRLLPSYVLSEVALLRGGPACRRPATLRRRSAVALIAVFAAVRSSRRCRWPRPRRRRRCRSARTGTTRA